MLFTIVCDYAGGTYIAQVQAPNADQALKGWATQMPETEVLGVTTRSLANAVIDSEAQAVAVSGLRNVWCWTAEVEGKLALLNVIQSG